MNRYATAGELSASIAHEVRQPLTTISVSGEAGSRLAETTGPQISRRPVRR